LIASLSSSVLTTFLIFCRVGTCLMVAPGYSRSNIPVQIRLFLAVNVTLMLSPLLDAAVRPVVEGAALPVIIRVIISELMIGLVIGLTARVFFLALHGNTHRIRDRARRHSGSVG
jgi:flagellar biosynthetic protein FliR